MNIYLLILIFSPFIFLTNILFVYIFKDLNLKINFFVGITAYLILQLFFFIFQNTYVLDINNYLAVISLNIFIFLGYFEFLSMLGRGFSLQILTDVYRAKTINKFEVHKIYSKNRGIDWMLTKRVSTLEKIGILDSKKEVLFFKNQKIYYLIFTVNILKKIFTIGKGGE